MNGQVWIAVVIGAAAAVEDIARRRISNWIPLSALVAGLAWNASQGGWRGAGGAVAGAAAGFAVFLVFYLLGGMGGGDVKLMAGFGAVLGFGRLIEAALWTAGAGGLFALGALGIARLRRCLGHPDRGGDARSIPYAPAIAVGAWLSLVPKG